MKHPIHIGLPGVFGPIHQPAVVASSAHCRLDDGVWERGSGADRCPGKFRTGPCWRGRSDVGEGFAWVNARSRLDHEAGAAKMAEQCDTAPVEESRRDVSEIPKRRGRNKGDLLFRPDQGVTLTDFEPQRMMRWKRGWGITSKDTQNAASSQGQSCQAVMICAVGVCIYGKRK